MGLSGATTVLAVCCSACKAACAYAVRPRDGRADTLNLHCVHTCSSPRIAAVLARPGGAVEAPRAHTLLALADQLVLACLHAPIRPQEMPVSRHSADKENVAVLARPGGAVKASRAHAVSSRAGRPAGAPYQPVGRSSTAAAAAAAGPGYEGACQATPDSATACTAAGSAANPKVRLSPDASHAAQQCWCLVAVVAFCKGVCLPVQQTVCACSHFPSAAPQMNPPFVCHLPVQRKSALATALPAQLRVLWQDLCTESPQAPVGSTEAAPAVVAQGAACLSPDKSADTCAAWG